MCVWGGGGARLMFVGLIDLSISWRLHFEENRRSYKNESERKKMTVEKWQNITTLGK